MEFVSLIRYSFAPFIAFLSLFGSTMGLYVFARPSLTRIGPRNIYRFMFAIEYLNLIILNEYLLDNFNIKLLYDSVIGCKLGWILFSAYMPIPSMLLVYISVERFISIAYASRRFFLRRSHIQLIYFLVLIVFNVSLYMFLWFYTNIVDIAYSNSTKSPNEIDLGFECKMENPTVYWVYIYIDLINRVVVPFLLMTLMAIMLIRQIYLSRKKFISSKSASKQRTFNRDVKFSLSITSINLVYLVFSLFYSSGYFFGFFFSNYNLYFFFEYITFFCYSLDFYVIVATNSLVRDELLKCLRQFW